MPLVSAVIVFGILPGSGISRLGDTLNVSCTVEATGNGLTPRKVTSPILLSPDKAKRAYTEVAANVALGNCANNSRLFLQSPSTGNRYSLVFLQEPTELQRGNGIRIIDWSPNGHLLLFEVIVWQYGSDARPGKDIFVYDSKAGVLFPVPVQNFAKQFGEGCVVDIDPLGFSSENRAILRVTARQEYDEESHPVQQACRGEAGLWLYDSTTYKVQALRDPVRIQHWGRRTAN